MSARETEYILRTTQSCESERDSCTAVALLPASSALRGRTVIMTVSAARGDSSDVEVWRQGGIPSAPAALQQDSDKTT